MLGLGWVSLCAMDLTDSGNSKLKPVPVVDTPFGKLTAAMIAGLLLEAPRKSITTPLLTALDAVLLPAEVLLEDVPLADVLLATLEDVAVSASACGTAVVGELVPGSVVTTWLTLAMTPA